MCHDVLMDVMVQYDTVLFPIVNTPEKQQYYSIRPPDWHIAATMLLSV